MKKIMFVGQAPPRTDPARPFGRTYLYLWLSKIGLTTKLIDRYCRFNALVSFFPGSHHGSHMAPTPAQIAAEKPRLIAAIESFAPHIIVPVGRLATQEFLGVPRIKLAEVVGRRFYVDPFAIFPLPHPSGASTWWHRPHHQELLTQALSLLAQELNLPTSPPEPVEVALPRRAKAAAEVS